MNDWWEEVINRSEEELYVWEVESVGDVGGIREDQIIRLLSRGRKKKGLYIKIVQYKQGRKREKANMIQKVFIYCILFCRRLGRLIVLLRFWEDVLFECCSGYL